MDISLIARLLLNLKKEYFDLILELNKPMKDLIISYITPEKRV